MLRIAKTTPGVLDLSAVKDEHGIPVTLIGPSYRDVPDHEESNPVLRRIVELRWVTVSKVSVETSNETASEVSSDPNLDPVPDDPPPSDPAMTAEPEFSVIAAEPSSASDNPDTQSDDQASATSVANVAPSPTVKPERKSSRRA